MRVSRMKNLILLVLGVTTLCLLLVAIPNRLSQQRQQRQMLSSLKALYEREALTLELDELPRSPTLYSVELADDASAAAQALLGTKAARADDEAERYETEYLSDAGTLTVTRMGGFTAQLYAAAPVSDPQRAAAKLLHAMGFQTDALTTQTQPDGSVYVSAEQTLLGVPVFGSSLVFCYEQGALRRVEGTFHTGGESITRVSEQESISGADALARFLARRDALGWVGGSVTALQQGYLPTETAGTGIRFVPVWRIDTDTGSFYINAITREITAI